MEPMTIAMIAGAVLGAQKSAEQQFAYKQQQKTEATKERWAPFSGRRGQGKARPDPTDPLMQSLLTAAMMGQQFEGGGAAQSAPGPSTGVGDGGTSAFVRPAYQGPVPAGQAPAAMDFDAYAQGSYMAPYRGGA